MQHIEQLHEHCHSENVCRIREELWLLVRKEVKNHKIIHSLIGKQCEP